MHPFPVVRDILQAIHREAKIFAKLDAAHGYFQFARDKESSHLTTFLLPQGRFWYKEPLWDSMPSQKNSVPNDRGLSLGQEAEEAKTDPPQRGIGTLIGR